MPKVRKEELPGTLRRSPAKAQRIYAETLASAHETYDSEERAHRAAIAALKHSFEKVGDHWEPKRRKGPSDPQAARRRPRGGGRTAGGRTAGGVDVEGHTRDELYARARKLGVRGRSAMTKMQLAQAVARKQD
jgi:cation transport regulator ChaB